MALNSSPSNQIEAISSFPDQSELDRFAAVTNKAADAAGVAIHKYFRKPFDIIDKEDSSKFQIFLRNFCFVIFCFRYRG